MATEEMKVWQFTGNNTSAVRPNESTSNQGLDYLDRPHRGLDLIQHQFEFGLLDYHDPQFDFIMFQIVCPVVYCLITLIGIAGNVLVIYVIMSRNNMRTTTNLLLLNLAMADIAFVLICPPFTAYQFAVQQWPFGDVLCKLMHYLINVTVYVTIYTLVLIAIIRFLTVVCNKQTIRLRTHTNAVMMMAAIWGFMLAANIPILRSYGTQFNYKAKHIECEHYSVQTAKTIYTLLFVMGYLIPLLIIGVLSCCIMVHIRGKRSLLLSQHQESNSRRKKANRLLISVVVVFALCWLPLHVHIMWAFYGDVPNNKTYAGISLFFNPIAYTNSCVNPFIYNYFSKDFRESFYQVMCFCSRRRHGDNTGEMNHLRNNSTVNAGAPRENGGPIGTVQKGVTDVTDLEIKALLPQTENNGDVIDMHAAGAVYIGEIKKEDFVGRKASYDKGRSSCN